MPIKEILLAGDSILRKKSVEVINPTSEGKLVADLKDTLVDFRETNGLGRGIAAPQIGILKRIIYLFFDEFKGELINPKITKHSEETGLYWDSCFSFKAAFFIKVKRWKNIEVQYFDLNGEKKTIKADGEISELLQHEIDHLDGILFPDRKVEQGEWIIMKEEWEKLGRPFRAK